MIASFAPTELVHLELQKLFQDFNFIMEDGTWKHFEFQSKNEGLEGLKRFRVYEAMTSYQHKVEVTTYVLYSGKIKNPMVEYSEGVNTYRVCPVIMQDRDSDAMIEQLEYKVRTGKVLTKQELIPLILSPLMTGKMSQKERIKTAYKITQNATALSESEIQKIEAVIYAMADKFLDSIELEEIKEEVKMTRLGQMLINDGINQGINQGISQGISQGIQALVETCKELEVQKEDVVEKVMKKFSLSRTEAEADVEKYWK